MNNKILISLLSVIILFNIVGGVFLFLQQREIRSLKENFIDIPAENIKDNEFKVLPENELTEIRKELNEIKLRSILGNDKLINGTVLKVSGEVLTVKALVRDVDAFKDANLDEARAIDMKFVEYGVKLDSDTKFEQREKSQLKEGDQVEVLSKDSIYGNSDILAERVTYLNPDEIYKDANNIQTKSDMENNDIKTE